MTDEETIKALCSHITELERDLVLVEQLREVRREFEAERAKNRVASKEEHDAYFRLYELRDKLELGE